MAASLGGRAWTEGWRYRCRPRSLWLAWHWRPRPVDLPGAKVIVTATHARPARQVLEGDSEGMAFADLVFTKGATTSQLVITPVDPRGMRLSGGGCDRAAIDAVDTAESPYHYVIREGRVVVTVPQGQGVNCMFFMSPAHVADTDTAPLPVPAPAGPFVPLPIVLVVLAGGLLAGLRRFRPATARS